jgi:small subunit ribosomal protein S8e
MSVYSKQRNRSSKTKKSGNGKRKIKFRGNRRSERGRHFTATKSSDKNITATIRHKGGSRTKVLKSAGFVNLLSGKTYVKAAIKNVLESKDNRNFARLNIITKGTVLDTDKGKAVVTNRPSREGCINARLIE